MRTDLEPNDPPSDGEAIPVTAEIALTRDGHGQGSPVVANDIINKDPIHQLVDDLKSVVRDPGRFPRTTKLLAAGVPQQAKKVVEEAGELAIEAMRHDRNAAVREAADLVYNLIVLLEGMNIPFDAVCRELEHRRAAYGIAAKRPKAVSGQRL
jgi:phosphoribosyl-ATP pyrophosphohydrolase